MRIISRTAAITFALIVSIGLLTAVVISPSLTRITNLSETIREEYIRIIQISSRAPRLKETSDTIQMIEQDLPALTSMLITQSKEIQFFTLLEDKSRLYKLNQKLRLGEAQGAINGILKIPLDIELKGSFANIMQFTQDLENSNVLFPVHSLDIRRPPQTSTTDSELTAILKGSIYVSAKP